MQQLSADLLDLELGDNPTSTYLTDRDEHAVDRLQRAFNNDRALSVMIGEGPAACGFVISRFIAGLGEDVAVARIGEPCVDATEFMGNVIDGVGFDPKDMTLEDLEGIFMMFLSYQNSHNRRTVICVERAQENELWVLDKLRELVQQELETPRGLMIVLSGQSGLKKLLHKGPLSTVNNAAGKRILLSPFTLAESKKYIRQRLNTAGKVGIDQLFQYQAITRIHELSDGVPDDLAALVNRCLEAATAEGIDLVTPELVQRAHEVNDDEDWAAETINMQGFRPRRARLVYQLTGEEMLDMALRQGHTLIGRSTMCDVCIDSTTVSRRHALISYSASGAVLVDLNSTNGTYVNGRRIHRHELQPGETIEVGGTSIEYIVDIDSAADPGS